MHGGGVAGGQVSTTLGSFEDGGDDFLENNTGNCCWRGGGGDGKAVDAKRVGAKSLF